MKIQTKVQRFKFDPEWVKRQSESPPTPSANSSLLLHFNGADEYDIFDSSSNHVEVTNLYGVNMGQPGNGVFGGRGLDNSYQSSLTVLAGDAWSKMTGDFTVDMWVRGNMGSNAGLLIAGSSGQFDTQTSFGFLRTGLSQPRLAFWNTSGTIFLSPTILGTRSVPAFFNDWTHVAITRIGPTVRMFIGGSLDKTATHTDVVNFGRFGTNFLIASGTASTPSTWMEEIDEVRIINGVGVWDSDFTPPTAPYTS